jgi:signal transduction histidine kinase
VAQVLSNLLTNAIKYAVDGDIQVRVWQEGQEARFSVQDEGPGIAPDLAEAIFEPGRRVVNGGSEDSKGAGLGLHIARGIVEAHHGRIWVESGPGRGTAFHVALPIAPAQTLEASNNAADSDASTGTAESPG